MPRIPSPNPDFKANPSVPTASPVYVHGMDQRRGFVPVAFQITSPFNHSALMPTALVMHVNPASFNQTYNKKIERIQTRGGFVEQHWGDDLDEISADGSTGAFMNIFTGLSSVLRQGTIAWDRYRDLQDIYRNNGSVYDPFGNIVLQGDVMVMYDKGTYLGYFKQFETEETDETPYAFKTSWTFKVKETILALPRTLGDYGKVKSPPFQSQNKLQRQEALRVRSEPTEEPSPVPGNPPTRPAPSRVPAANGAPVTRPGAPPSDGGFVLGRVGGVQFGPPLSTQTPSSAQSPVAAPVQSDANATFTPSGPNSSQ